jgi:hypothetical protein
MNTQLRHPGFILILAILVLPALPGRCFYNPSTGSWLNRDPAGEGDCHSLFLFVGNDPLSAVDLLGDKRVQVVGTLPTAFSPAGYENQLQEYSASILADWMKFTEALVALCPLCGETNTFNGLHGKQECTRQKCIEQAHSLAAGLLQDYREVFVTEYNKFGDIQAGWKANERANEAPFHGEIATDYDKGFGLKCAGWMDLTADEFFKSIRPYYGEGSQCFRAARVGWPSDPGSWRNHSWVIIYGPRRGPLNTSMYKKSDYDVNIDPWPFAGALIMNPRPWDAARMDQPLLW